MFSFKISRFSPKKTQTGHNAVRTELNEPKCWLEIVTFHVTKGQIVVSFYIKISLMLPIKDKIKPSPGAN